MKKKKHSGRIGTVLIVLGVLLLAASAGLTLYNYWDADRAARASETIVTKIQEKVEESAAEEPEELEVQAKVAPQYREMPTVTLDGYEYIGTIEIPSMDIDLPIMYAWDYTRLKISPCRYSGSYYTDDLVLCGHNYAKHFSHIRWLDIGADVYFTNVKGERIHYTVSNIETIQPTAVDEMIENTINSDRTAKWDLTLFTCNMGGQTRCAVRCLRAEDSPNTDLQEELDKLNAQNQDE